MTSILIHRPRPALHDGLLAALAASDSIEEVHTAVSVEDLLTQYKKQRPDVVLVGLEIDDLVELVRHLRVIDPTGSIIVVGGRDRGSRTAQAIAAGARGFLGRDEVMDLRPAAAGRAGLSRLPGSGGMNRPPLTAREQQVLVGMSEGRSNSEIGREFFLSEDTIKTHARRMFRKLGAKDRAEAVAIGFRTGVLL